MYKHIEIYNDEPIVCEVVLWRLSAETYEKIIEKNGAPLCLLEQWCNFTDGYKCELLDEYKCEAYMCETCLLLREIDLRICNDEDHDHSHLVPLIVDSEEEFQTWIKTNTKDGKVPPQIIKIIKKISPISEEVRKAFENKQVVVLLGEIYYGRSSFELMLPDNEKFEPQKLELLYDYFSDENDDLIYRAQYAGKDLDMDISDATPTQGNWLEIYDYREDEHYTFMTGIEPE